MSLDPNKLEIGMMVGICPGSFNSIDCIWDIYPIEKLTKQTVVVNGITFNRNHWFNIRGSKSAYSSSIVSSEEAQKHNDFIHAYIVADRQRLIDTMNRMIANISQYNRNTINGVYRALPDDCKEKSTTPP